VDALRIRAYPFCDDIMAFIAAHEDIFVVEQNSDAQLRGMLILEGNLNAAKLIPVLHYDGTPITARFIAGAIAGKLGLLNVTPLKQVAQ
jgi:2-oxoglutarate ferredoxin oxidoreductase subunit alpha